MRGERLIPRGSADARAVTERTQVVMDLTSRLNVLRHSDVEARAALLGEILGRPVPATLTLYPPRATPSDRRRGSTASPSRSS